MSTKQARCAPTPPLPSRNPHNVPLLEIHLYFTTGPNRFDSVQSGEGVGGGGIAKWFIKIRRTYRYVVSTAVGRLQWKQ